MLALPVLILAAGRSSRMRGADKLLEPVHGGKPLLLDRIEAALGTGQPVLVTLPPRDERPDRWALIDELPVAAIEVSNAADGLSASVSAGVDALPEMAVAVMLVLADMPDLTSEDMRRVMADFDGETILRGATADGVAGHPVIFPARDFPALRSLDGDRGAQILLRENRDRVRPVTLPYSHARTDLDTPEDWEAWRNRREEART